MHCFNKTCCRTIAASIAVMATLALVSHTPVTQAAESKTEKPLDEKVKPKDKSGWSASIIDSLADTDLSDQQKELVSKINAYLNTMNDIKGRFLQINPDDSQQKGKFYLKRPGRIRFDYSPPSLQRVVSDGRFLSIEDRDINTVDRFPLENTPFRILLAAEVNLVRDAIIKTVIETDDEAAIIMIDRNGSAIGQIELIFTKNPEMVLKEWKVTDASDQVTRVILTNLTSEEEIDGKLFNLEQVSDPFFTP